jgi:hypothetical protein
VNGWMDVQAVLRIAYRNQKRKRVKKRKKVLAKTSLGSAYSNQQNQLRPISKLAVGVGGKSHSKDCLHYRKYENFIFCWIGIMEIKTTSIFK